MEYAKPYVAPAMNLPVSPMHAVHPAMHMPNPAMMPNLAAMPMANVKPTAIAPIMEKPLHHDNIHLHASYTSIHFPPQPKLPVAVSPYTTAGGILVLFILLVIISRGLHPHIKW